MFAFRRFLEDFSTYACLVPLTAGLAVYRLSSKEIKYFFLFLLWGFAIDLPRNYMSRSPFDIGIYNFYSLTEVLFMLWFIKKKSSEPLVIKISQIGLSFLFIFWIFCHFFLNQHFLTSYSRLFDSISSIIISCIAAWELLQISKRQSNLFVSADFWFITGIFFYFFCANFIFSLIEDKELQDKIWWIHDIINILTYFIYTKAFLVAGKESKNDQS